MHTETGARCVALVTFDDPYNEHDQENHSLASGTGADLQCFRRTDSFGSCGARRYQSGIVW